MIRADDAVLRKSQRIMQGNVVDTLETKKKSYYIHPRGRFKIIWDTLISMTLVYYAFIVPIRWSQRIHSTPWLAVDSVLDAMSWIDIILLFFTATIGPNIAIKTNKAMAKRYIMTFFIIDIVGTLPLYRIRHDLYLFKILRLVQTYRTNRLIVNAVMGTRISFRKVKLIIAFFVFLAALNLLIAIWIFPGEINLNDDNWLAAINFHSNDTAEDASNLWLMGAFFIVTTITTVGFGDILAHNSKEMMLVMMFQVFFFLHFRIIK